MTGKSFYQIRAAINLERDTFGPFDYTQSIIFLLTQQSRKVPNRVEETQNECRVKHLGENEIIKLTYVIALTSFLNRFSDTTAAKLRPDSLEIFEKSLKAIGWASGKDVTTAPSAVLEKRSAA